MTTSISVNQYDPTQIRDILVPWVENNAGNEYAYTWPYATFTFLNEEDALAFVLKFGGSRVETTPERMIREQYENSFNRR